MSIQTLLIANRGEIARRIMRSAHDMGIQTVAVYVEADAEAPFVSEADQAVRLPDSYLDGKSIIEAALTTGAQAIHPGYGFLSENADFARETIAAGIAWVGPTPEAIAQMGDKLAAKELATRYDVPILVGSQDPADAASIGYPILVKAAAGGGGKGMRIVERPEDLEEAIASAKREAASGFGDDRVFLERYVARSRHVEIQILGDTHGNIVHLGERECSIQRRHQKIIEESPSPRLDEAMRSSMGDAALRLARGLGYQSAGTVEFLVDDESGEYFFLEVNTRLQVEHPVTEAVTGIDLVRAQLRIADGKPLDFSQEELRSSGTAIEARLYAENPANDFLPATGRLDAFAVAERPTVRWDSGVEQGTTVGTDFDPMLAKVIAHAATRAEAAGRLALALERLHLGGIVTNRDFLVATLRTKEFLAGDTTTDFIERVKPSRSLSLSDDELERIARIGALWIQAANRSEARVLASSPSGWRNARMPFERVGLAFGDRELLVRYRACRDGSFEFEDGTRARIYAWTQDSIDLEIGRHRQSSRITRTGDRLIVQCPTSDVEFSLVPRFVVPGDETASGGVVAPMPGKVIEIRVAVGDSVTVGQTLILLEAMKMEHPMRAAVDGVVSEIKISAGDQVENEALLLIIEPTQEDESSSS
ncbi:MAG: biotin carboxylase N-terminal domain-containing protein [Myxococcota bacterium]